MGASPTPPSADARAGVDTDPGAVPVVCVAVSGGRDSTALLHATVRAAQALGVRVHALHVHHGLQSAADAWAAHVQRQCRRWKVGCSVRRLEGAPAAAESVEAWARRGRYLALAEMAREAGSDTVLLAHHRRDQAETVLLQLMRGAGSRGLAAMPMAAWRDGIHWLRPWRDRPRSAIEDYVRRHRLRHVDDASNDDPRYARNRLRAQAWGALDEAFPAAEAALAIAARRAADEAAALAELVAMDAGVAMDAEAALVKSAWMALSAPRRLLLLRHAVEAWTGQGAQETLVRRLADELPRCPSGSWPAPGGQLWLRRGRLSYRAL